MQLTEWLGGLESLMQWPRSLHNPQTPPQDCCSGNHSRHRYHMLPHLFLEFPPLQALAAGYLHQQDLWVLLPPQHHQPTL